MAVIEAVITDLGRDLIAKHLAGLEASVSLSYFKIGEAGFSESGGVKTPKTPDHTKTSIESDGVALTGDPTFSNGSPTVTGTTTLFLSEVQAGQFIRLDADLEWVEVQSVDSDTQITLTGNYGGTGGTGTGAVIAVPYFVFKKIFTGLDFVFEGDGSMRATVFLDFLEGNSGGFGGGNPEYFEVGVYDADDQLIGYGTYPGETKTAAIQFNKLVRIAFIRD